MAGTARRRRHESLTGAVPWSKREPGVLRLPSGRLVRGRGLRYGTPPGMVPDFGLYLHGRFRPPTPWPSRLVKWPDWWLPSDRDDAADALAEAWQRADAERVEVACTCGRGRTGTALACLAILDGVPAADAVAYVRRHYDARAVETLWQRRYVSRFRPLPLDTPMLTPPLLTPLDTPMLTPPLLTPLETPVPTPPLLTPLSSPAPPMPTQHRRPRRYRIQR